MSQGSAISFDARQHRILPAGVEEAAAFVKTVGFARQDGGEVEAEAVDPHLGGPVAQGIRDHLQHALMRQVDGVAGSGVVDVVAPVVRQQPIIAGVVDALERERRSEFVALGGMVVDDVEDDFDAMGVKLVHHRLEFVRARRLQIARLGREEGERIVAPVVPQVPCRPDKCRRQRHGPAAVRRW